MKSLLFMSVTECHALHFRDISFMNLMPLEASTFKFPKNEQKSWANQGPAEYKAAALTIPRCTSFVFWYTRRVSQRRRLRQWTYFALLVRFSATKSYVETFAEFKEPYFLNNEHFSKLEKLLIFRGSSWREGIQFPPILIRGFLNLIYFTAVVDQGLYCKVVKWGRRDSIVNLAIVTIQFLASVARGGRDKDAIRAETKQCGRLNNYLPLSLPSLNEWVKGGDQIAETQPLSILLVYNAQAHFLLALCIILSRYSTRGPRHVLIK